MPFRDELLRQLPSLVLGTLAGKLGGPQALGSFQQGMAQRGQYEDAQARQADLDAQRMEQQAYERGRQGEADQRAAESADLQRRQALLTALGQYDADPAALGQFYGVPSEQVQAIAAPVISQRKARAIRSRAKAKLDEIAAEFKNNPDVLSGESHAYFQDSQLVDLMGPEFPSGKLTVQALRELAELQATAPSGEPVRPKAGAAQTSYLGTSRILSDVPLDRQHAAAVASGDVALAKQIEDAMSRQDATRRDPRQPADPSVTAQRQFTMEQRLAAQWEKSSSPFREMRRQLLLMETGLRRFRAGDKNGGSQAVLVTFQKILDPTSVVRESEYARTATGQSFLNRIEGFTERLAQGGAGMTDAELQAMVGTAREFLAGMQNFNAGTRQRLERTATEYRLDPRMIFDDVDIGGGQSQSTPSGPSSAPASGDGWVVIDGIRIREKKP